MIKKHKLWLLLIATLAALFLKIGSPKSALAFTPANPGCYEQVIGSSGYNSSQGCVNQTDSSGQPTDPSRYCYLLTISSHQGQTATPYDRVDCSQIDKSLVTGSNVNGLGGGTPATLTPSNCDTTTTPGNNGQSPVNGPVVGCTDTSTACKSQGSGSTQVNDLKGCIGNTGLIKDVINPAVKVFTIIFGVICVIMLIVSGIIYSTSADDPQRVTLAKKIIRNTLIAIAAYVFLYAFLSFILPQGL